MRNVLTWMMAGFFLVLFYQFPNNESFALPSDLLSFLLSLAIATIFALFALYTGICIHEFGHALFALIAGMPVKKVQIGIGPPVLTFHLGHTAIVITKGFNGGFTALGQIDERHLRKKLLLFMMGGVVANLVTALLCAYAAGGFFFASGDSLVTKVILLFGWVNFLLFAVNLLPFATASFGFFAQTDGKNLLRLPNLQPVEIADCLASGAIMDGYDLILASRFNEAEAHYRTVLQTFPESGICKINLSHALIKQLKIDEAKEAIRTLVSDDFPDHHRGMANLNLAWITLMEGTTTSADEGLYRATAAHKIFPNLPPIQSTLGCAMIENGAVDEGIKILEKVEVKTLSPYEKETLGHLAYLAYGYWLKEDGEKVETMVKRINELYAVADLDQQAIVDRLRIKTFDFGRSIATIERGEMI